MISRTWRILIAICTTFLAPQLEAHVVEQFYAELIEEKGEWKIEVLFDIGYALPEMRNDPTAPQPTRDWLLSRSPEEMTKLRQGSETYLRGSLHFSQHDLEVETDYHFKDFDQTPPNFHRNLLDGGYLRIVITPLPRSRTKAIQCRLTPETQPNLVLKQTPEGKEAEYLTIKPGGVFLLGTDLAPGSPLKHHAWQTGFTHVLPMGLDHLCFILGLFLFRRELRSLLWQSLAFTVAHTLTLGLSAARILPQTQQWVEIFIPISIAAVAWENLRSRPLAKGRLLIVFFFGLIHGMGFASALQKTFPDGDTFFPVLLLTNLGIECAQVTILLAAWLFTYPLVRGNHYEKFRRRANYGLLILALLWLGERLIEVYGS